jgi:hypothetical protein
MKHKLVREFVDALFQTYNLNRKEHLPDGHILDEIFIEEDRDLSGMDIMNEHVIPAYPEAKLQSWDKW